MFNTILVGSSLHPDCDYGLLHLPDQEIRYHDGCALSADFTSHAPDPISFFPRDRVALFSILCSQ